MTAAATNPEDVFRAISDPTRRQILDLLASGERAVRDLVARFSISQPAVSQHLRVLRHAGLVTERKEGRLRIYAIEAGPLRAIYDWSAHYQRFWGEHLDQLGDYLDRVPDSPDTPNTPDTPPDDSGREQK